MTDIVTILVAATANVTGPAFDAGDLKSGLTLETITTGSVSAFSVQLQGSMDGASWVALGSPQTTATTAGVSTSTLARYFRAVLSGFTGTGTVTVKLGFTAGAGYTGALQAASNLSDLPSPAAARANLGTGRPGLKGTGMVPVATRSHTYGGTSSTTFITDGGRSSRTLHYTIVESGAVRLVFGNFQMANAVPGETAGANSILVRASIEDTGGVIGAYRYTTSSTAWSSATAYATGDVVTLSGATYISLQASNTNHTPATSTNIGVWWNLVNYYPVHFPGESASRDVTIAPGQVVISDPVQLTPSLAKTVPFFVNTVVQPNNGTANTGSYPAGSWASTAAGGGFVASAVTGSAPGDYTLAAPTTAVTLSISSSNPMYGPMCVIGLPKPGQAPAVVFLDTDSYGQGGSEAATLFGTEWGSWMTRLLCDSATTPAKFLYPYMLSGKSGSHAGYDTGPGFTARLLMASMCTHFVDQKAVNDFNSSLTLSALQAIKVPVWDACARMGIKVIACTIPSKTTSTDGFITTVNQAPATGFGFGSAWDQYNQWLRTFPHAAISAVIDVASAVTVTDPVTGFPVWAPGLNNADGLHPNTAGDIAIAATATMYLASAPAVPATINAASLFGAVV